MVDFERVAELERKGIPFALATVVRSRGSVPRRAATKMLVFQDGAIEGTIGGGKVESLIIEEAKRALSEGETRFLHYRLNDPEQGDPGVCGGEMDVYVEPVRPEPKVVVFGAGHVGKAVAHLAGWLGFRVVVADDRKGFATESDVPEAERRLTCALEELPDRLDIDEQTYLILTTRGVPVDAAGLPALLESPAGYIGVIGSRRRWETTVQELVEAGVEKEKLRRVTSPMGLELNAETPEEIALSIMAEIVMLRRSGTGEKMAHLPKSLRASK